MSPAKLACIGRFDREPLSLDQPVEDNDVFLGEIIEDRRENDPLKNLNQEMLKSRLADVLESLDYREREILRLRYGLADGCNRTLDQVSRVFAITKERVRQIEKEAMRVLRQPACARRLAGFLEDAHSASTADIE
jgi:RNA polymerase primary sigma factor